MAKIQPLAYPLRLPEDLMRKLKVVSEENGRSVNKEIEIIVKSHISNFEKENGTIEIEYED